MNNNHAGGGRSLWLLWALAGAMGWAMGFPIEGDFLWSPGWLLAGVVTGTLQAFLLWQFMSRGKLWQGWMLASIAGWAASALMLGTATDDWPDMAVLGLMMAAGLPVGTLQWLVLRQYRVNAGLWMVAHSLGIGVAVMVVLWVNLAVGYVGSVIAAILMGSLFGIVGGVVTGSVLMWLLRKTLLDGSSLGQLTLP